MEAVVSVSVPAPVFVREPPPVMAEVPAVSTFVAATSKVPPAAPNASTLPVVMDSVACRVPPFSVSRPPTRFEVVPTLTTPPFTTIDKFPPALLPVRIRMPAPLFVTMVPAVGPAVSAELMVAERPASTKMSEGPARLSVPPARVTVPSSNRSPPRLCVPSTVTV